jgi:5-methylcytosine-specific restriction endonuclease McrA
VLSSPSWLIGEEDAFCAAAEPSQSRRIPSFVESAPAIFLNDFFLDAERAHVIDTTSILLVVLGIEPMTNCLQVLDQSVLVLNRDWLAINVCNAKRALCFLYRDIAKVVTEEYETYDFDSWRELSQYADEQVIHTPTFKLKIPDVIMLTRFGKCPPRHIKFNRRNIFLRDNHTCQYCGRKPQKDDLTIDHVVPRSLGGRSEWENVALACTDCNTRKGGRALHEIGMRLLRKPRKPHWLSCVRFPITNSNRQAWQKFIDHAYWNVVLKEE